MPPIFVPKNRSSREHVGALDRVVWADDDQPFTILRLTDGATVKIGADSTQFDRGQLYRFHGRWIDGKFGPEFAADTHTLDAPQSRGAVVKYLSEMCRGVGKVTAERLWDKFGHDAVRVVREDPDAVANAGLLSPDAARDASLALGRFAELEHTRVELFGLFAGRGFPGKLIDRCIGTWGVAAPAVVRRDPFKLLIRRLPGCGFKRCDKLYLDLKLNPSALRRQAMCALNAMKEDRTGSTWLDADAVAKATTDVIPSADPYRALVLLRRAGLIRVRRDGRERFLAPRERADAEQRIADSVRRLSRAQG